MNSALSAKQQAAKLMRVSAIRDDFIKRVRSTGQTCALGAPAMLVHDVASFGAYDEAATIATADWTMLGPSQKAILFPNGRSGSG